jgi:hypothetical protein
MRVAFIGNAWHQKTGSSRFLVDLLEQHASVEHWSGEPGNAATKDWAADFNEDRYDAIVIWQLHEAFERLSGHHPNVVFVPMYDAMLWGGAFFWKQVFNTAKILCFSWRLRQEVMRRAAVHAGFQYYPDPARHVPAEDFTTLRGFLWYRRREISPHAVFRLCEGTEFERFTVHDAADPDNAAEGPWIAPANIHRLERTGWSEDRSAYDAALRAANVFFAPRLFEGIGMSLLEAMAAGHCVVAPNAPTMNEYISHGTNGLLYLPNRPARLDFTDARTLGARARESVERGSQRWRSSIPALLNFIMTPAARLGAGARPGIPVNKASVPLEQGLVSVVTMCRDGKTALALTSQSVLAQSGCDFESLVLDGPSADGSLDVIRHHGGQRDAWRTAPIPDPLDTMNAALDLVRGEWVLFMNAGDTFAGEDALHRMFAGLPAGVSVVYGHHIQRLEDGTQALRRAAEFATTWSRLRCGDLWLDWLTGIPGQPAVAIGRALLTRLRFDARFRSASGLDLLFRAHAEGARFFNCDEVIAIEGSRKSQNDGDGREWAAVARLHGDAAAVARFCARLDADGRADAASTTVARLGRLALRVVTTLDRHTPALARTAERIARGAAVRSVIRRLLIRTPADRDAR